MKQVNISEIINSDTFDTLAQADEVLKHITDETKEVDFRRIGRFSSAAIHHLIVVLCIRPGFGWSKLNEIRFILPDKHPYFEEVFCSALDTAKEFYEEKKPYPPRPV